MSAVFLISTTCSVISIMATALSFSLSTAVSVILFIPSVTPESSTAALMPLPRPVAASNTKKGSVVLDHSC